MIRVAGRLLLSQTSDVELVERLLPEHIRLSREEPGCISFVVTRSATDPLVYEVEEEFVSHEAFEIHQKRTKASVWGTETSHLRRSYGIISVPGISNMKNSR